MDPKRIELLARQLAGHTTPDEDAELQVWIDTDPAWVAYERAIRRAWSELGVVPNVHDSHKAWAELVSRIERSPGSSPRGAGYAKVISLGLDSHTSRGRSRRLSSRRLSSWFLGIAAVAIFAVAGVLVWRATRIDATRAAARVSEYTTRPGQRAELRLPDGTRVLVNVDGVVRVPTDFGARTRELELDGEAFFDVRHDPSRPFRVHTDRGVAEAVGTEFVVSAYPERAAMTVAVVSGTVGLRAPASRSGAADHTAIPADDGFLVRLGRGDVARLDSLAAPAVRRGVDLTPYIGWTDGSLVFEGVPLGDALARIERWYDVNVELAHESLAERRLTATFHDEPLSDVLDVLALSFDLRIERRGRTIVLALRDGSTAH